MADQHLQHIPEMLIRAAVTEEVAAALGNLSRKLGDLTKGMTEADEKEAKIMTLEMMRTACGEFYTKMRARIGE